MKKSDNVPSSLEALGGKSAGRLPRLESVVRQELAQIMTREMEWPMGTLVTISKVAVLQDLSATRVGLSVLPFDQRQKALSVAIRAKAVLQRFLNKRLRVYRIPKIEFYIDETSEQRDYMERLLDSIKEE